MISQVISAIYQADIEKVRLDILANNRKAIHTKVDTLILFDVLYSLEIPSFVYYWTYVIWKC